MQQETYKAIVFGGTGAMGSKLIKNLIECKRFSKITNVGRKIYDEETVPKQVHQIKVKDFDKMSEDEGLINELKQEKYDIGFSCFGTTKSDAGGAEQFKKIDYGYNIAFAKLCRDSDIKHYGLISSQGASSSSWFFYLKVKGEIEEYIKNLKFHSFAIYQPGLLDRGNKMRTGEKIFSVFTTPISGDSIGKAMIYVALGEMPRENNNTIKYYTNKEIWNIEKQYDKEIISKL